MRRLLESIFKRGLGGLKGYNNINAEVVGFKSALRSCILSLRYRVARGLFKFVHFLMKCNVSVE